MILTPKHAAVAIKPSFITKKADQRLLLWRGSTTLSSRGRSKRGRGACFYSWLPTPRAIFEFYGTARFVNGSFDIGGQKFPFLLTESSERRTKGIIRKGRRILSAKHVFRLRFYLVNFINFYGKWISRPPDRRAWAGRHEFKKGDWHVVVDSIPEAQQDQNRIVNEGGFRITHVGEVTRVDKRRITKADAERVIEILSHLFSFANGSACAPVLSQGIDNTGGLVWQDLGASSVTRKRPITRWIHPQYFDVSDLFEGLIARHEDVVWWNPLRFAIDWYLNSNSGTKNLETSIVLAQIALELLAWTLFVENLKQYSARNFKNTRTWPASKKIGLLLGHFKLQTSIPSSLRALKSYARSKGISDGPVALTKIRNIIAHGNRALPGIHWRVRLQAKDLALWYLDLILLKLLGYRGKYMNRTLSKIFQRPRPIPV